MPLVMHPRNEVIDGLSLASVHEAPEIVTQQVGGGMLIGDSSVHDLGGETTIIVRWDVTLEDVSEVVEVTLALRRPVQIRDRPSLGLR